jgi:hypothetical protein
MDGCACSLPLNSKIPQTLLSAVLDIGLAAVTNSSLFSRRTAIAISFAPGELGHLTAKYPDLPLWTALDCFSYVGELCIARNPDCQPEMRLSLANMYLEYLTLMPGQVLHYSQT